MFIEAIDKLRCVREHEDSWLVAKFVEMRDRDIWEGELGCPVCEARYMIREGVVYFTPMRPRAAADEVQGSDSPEDLFAVAAMLDLSAPERTIVLCDTWTRFASGLSEISEPHLFVVNGVPRETKSECIYEVVTSGAIPLGPASADGVALDPSASPALIRSAVNVLKEGGRLIAGRNSAVPDDILLLASDEAHWVGQKRGNFIPLRRASR